MAKEEPLDLTRLDKEQVEKRKKELERVRRYREIKDLRGVLATPEGRRVWRRLLETCGAYRTPYVGEFPYTNHVNIGRQQIGQWALSEMDEARPEAYTEIAREYKSDVLFSEKLDKEAEQEMIE
jgi:hypothetical protein